MQDVAGFLGVDAGLFYFDASYRPVPLETQFVGVSERNILQAKNIMDEVCYEKVSPPPFESGVGLIRAREHAKTPLGSVTHSAAC